MISPEKAFEDQHLFLIENIPQGVIYQYKNGGIFYVNCAAEKILGYTAEQLMGKSLLDKDWKIIQENKSILPNDINPVAVALQTGKPVRNQALGFYNPVKEKYVWLNVSSLPRFEDISGQPTEVITIIEDITEKLLEVSDLKHKTEEYAALNEEYAALNEEYKTTNEELKEANEQLLKSKAYIENALEHVKFINNELQKTQSVAQIGSWKWNIPEDRLEWSPEMFRVFEINPAFFTGKLSDIMVSCIHPDDRLKVEEINRKVLEEGMPIPIEYRIVLPENKVKTIWAEAGELIKDEDGRPKILSGFVQDISERKRLEKERQEKDILYRTLIEKGSDILILSDSDGRPKYFSSSITSILGYNTHELIGISFLEVMHPEDVPTLQASFHQLKSQPGSSVRISARHKHKNGTYRWIEGSATNLLNEPDVNSIVVNFHDVTNNKESEEKLRESESRFSTIFHSSPVAISLLKIPGNQLVAANEAHYNLFGFREDELFNHNAWDLNIYVNLEDREILMSELKINGKFNNKEVTVKNKLGKICILQCSAEIVQISGQEYIMVMMSDVTEQKQTEEKIKTSERNLKLFVDHAPAAIAMFDTNMRYIAVSKRFLKDYNLKDFDLVGKSHYEIFPEIDEKWKNVHKRCLAGAVEVCEEDLFPRADGKVDWLRWEIHPWYEKPGHIGGLLLFSEVITTRKNHEIALRLSEEKFRSLFENIQIGIVLQDTEGNIELMNRAAENILGGTIDEIRKNLWTSGINKAYREDGSLYKGDELPSSLSIKSGKPVINFTVQISRLKTGEKIWINKSAIPIKKADTGESLVYLIFEDITERIKYNRENQKLRTAFYQSSSSFVITDKKGVIEDINHQTEIISGYSRNEILYKTPALFKSGFHNNSFFSELWETIGSGNTWEGQICNKHKNGKLYWIYCIISPIKNKDGIITHYFATSNDITQQKEDREELIKYREHLEMLVEERSREAKTVSDKLLNLIYSMPLGYIETDLSGNITSFNKTAEKIFGYKSRSVLGKPIVNNFLLSSENVTLSYEKSNNVEVFIQDHYLKNKLINCRWNSVKLTSNTDHLIGFAYIIEDITLMKQAEHSLQFALDKERELHKLKTNFVSMTSHQFRTPLTTILSNTEMLETLTRKLKEEDAEQIKRFTKRIYDNIERLDLLMSDVLLVGKSQAGKINFRPQLVNLIHFVKSLISDSKFPYQNNRQPILTIKGVEKELIADPQLLSHIIQNLLSNAFKYSDLQVEIKIEFLRNYVRLSVVDKGIGIPEEDQVRLFNSFFRASNTERLIGSGLGLVIVKEYVELHNGTISFISKINEGSEFTVEFPYSSTKNLNSLSDENVKPSNKNDEKDTHS